MIQCAKCGCEVTRCTCKTEYQKVNADDHADVPVVPEQNGTIEEIDCELLGPTCDLKCASLLGKEKAPRDKNDSGYKCWLHSGIPLKRIPGTDLPEAICVFQKVGLDKT